MKPLRIAVASGKGGTGKTTVALNLALSLTEAQYIDCDAETPNGHLFLHPQIREWRQITHPVPKIDPERCDLCGDCATACEFNALAVSKERVLLFADLCHGCGACSYVCREKGAITEVPRSIGMLEFGISSKIDGSSIDFAQCRLNVGEPSAVPLIKAVKEIAKPQGTVILDAPPGTACNMVEALQDCDYCLLVSEPTPFGLNDLKLALDVARQMKIPTGVVLNRCDIGDQSVVDYCRQQDVSLLLEIPFQRDLAEAYSRGEPWMMQQPQWRQRFQALFQTVCTELDG